MSEIGNALMPQAQAQAAPSPQLPDAHAGLAGTIGKAHDAASAQLSKLQAAKTLVSHIRSGLENLTKLGDMVGAEDVIKAAGDIVGKGGDPIALAGMLANMPEGGQAIQSWVTEQAAKLAQNEAQLTQQLNLAKHQTASAALHVMAMDHIGQKFQPPQGEASPEAAGPMEQIESEAGNALTP